MKDLATHVPGWSESAPGHWSVRLHRSLCDGRSAIAEETLIARELQRRQTQPVAVIWSSRRCLVVSSRDTGSSRFSAAAEQLRNSGWPVVVRSSGGSVVPQGPGVVNLSLMWLAPAQGKLSIVQHYWRLFDVIQQALKSLDVDATMRSVPGAFCDGRFNVAIGHRKFGGTAQRWMVGAPGQRVAVIAHAALLAEPLPAPAVEAIELYQRVIGCDAPFDPTTCISLAEHRKSLATPPKNERPAVDVLASALQESCRAMTTP
jgi:octanoyl-[GcvH]:protein N-octanoyltransferase